MDKKNTTSLSEDFELQDEDIEEVSEEELLEAAEYSSEVSSTQIIINDVAKIPTYTKEEEKEAFKALSLDPDNKDLKNDIIMHNMKLVIFIAGKYAKVCKSLDMDDLIIEGYFGLIRAVEEYDYKKGFSFSTYAWHWIHQSITRAISNYDSTIRIPVHVKEKMNKLRTLEGAEREAFLEMHGDILQYEYLESVRSLDEPLKTDSDDDASALGDFIEAPDVLTGEQSVINHELNQKINDVVDKFARLTKWRDRTKDIIERRFGLNGRRIETLVEIANDYGISRERVRQIEGKFIMFARHSSLRKFARDYNIKHIPVGGKYYHDLDAFPVAFERGGDGTKAYGAKKRINDVF